MEFPLKVVKSHISGMYYYVEIVASGALYSVLFQIVLCKLSNLEAILAGYPKSDWEHHNLVCAVSVSVSARYSDRGRVK